MSYKDLRTANGRSLSIPLLQGGMGVGVSMGGLAGAVAHCGGMGTISTADCGFREPDFSKEPEKANLRALKKEIEKAQKISEGHGLVAVNVMVATRQFEDAVKTAVESGVDAVVSGAGLPLNLPELVPEGSALIAPIVSSGRAIKLISKVWKQKYDRYPDFVVLEGPKAGGHLGFKEEELLDGTCSDIFSLIKEVKDALASVEEAAGRSIPLFAAGGIFDKDDVEKTLSLGADGVQLASRFIATDECDASDTFKKMIVEARPEDVRIIHSPVGMPGRALYTPFLKRLEKEGRIAPTYCWRCIKTCEVAKVPYCITKALIAAVEGDVENGLFFSGAEVGRIDRVMPVSELVSELGM